MNPTDAAAHEYVGRLTRAGKETVSAQLALARQSVDLARAAAAGEKSASAAGREYFAAVAAEFVRWGTQTGELARVQLDGVAALGASLAGAVFQDRTRRDGGDREAQRSLSGRPAPADGAVALHGPIGGTAEGSVVVANRHPRKRVVHLAAEQLTDEDGGAIAAVLEVQPKRFTVPPGQEHAFRLAVRLTEGEVISGATYASLLRISGGEEATVHVTVRVD